MLQTDQFISRVLTSGFSDCRVCLAGRPLLRIFLLLSLLSIVDGVADSGVFCTTIEGVCSTDSIDDKGDEGGIPSPSCGTTLGTSGIIGGIVVVSAGEYDNKGVAAVLVCELETAGIGGLALVLVIVDGASSTCKFDELCTACRLCATARCDLETNVLAGIVIALATVDGVFSIPEFDDMENELCKACLFCADARCELGTYVLGGVVVVLVIVDVVFLTGDFDNMVNELCKACLFCVTARCELGTSGIGGEVVVLVTDDGVFSTGEFDDMENELCKACLFCVTALCELGTSGIGDIDFVVSVTVSVIFLTSTFDDILDELSGVRMLDELGMSGLHVANVDVGVFSTTTELFIAFTNGVVMFGRVGTSGLVDVVAVS